MTHAHPPPLALSPTPAQAGLRPADPVLRARRPIWRSAANSCLIAALAALAGCGGNGGDVGVAMGGGGSAGGALNGNQGAVSLAMAPWIVLDLATGKATALATMSDPSTTALRSTSMAFRRVTAPGGEVLVALCETTQAQWTLLGGGTPWTAVDASLAGAQAVGGDRPAFALSHRAITATLTAWNASHSSQLRLPTGAEWDAAAGGGSGAFTWGSATDRSALAAHAVVYETLGATAGPRAVGSLAPSPLGFFDLHGNVWEWLDGGSQLAGGSWRDGIQQARIGNRLGAEALVGPDTDHLLFGLRLVLRL